MRENVMLWQLKLFSLHLITTQIQDHGGDTTGFAGIYQNKQNKFWSVNIYKQAKQVLVS
jgi:hypothetical protein